MSESAEDARTVEAACRPPGTERGLASHDALSSVCGTSLSNVPNHTFTSDSGHMVALNGHDVNTHHPDGPGHTSPECAPAHSPGDAQHANPNTTANQLQAKNFTTSSNRLESNKDQVGANPGGADSPHFAAYQPLRMSAIPQHHRYSDTPQTEYSYYNPTARIDSTASESSTMSPVSYMGHAATPAHTTVRSGGGVLYTPSQWASRAFSTAQQSFSRRTASPSDSDATMISILSKIEQEQVQMREMQMMMKRELREDIEAASVTYNAQIRALQTQQQALHDTFAAQLHEAISSRASPAHIEEVLKSFQRLAGAVTTQASRIDSQDATLRTLSVQTQEVHSQMDSMWQDVQASITSHRQATVKDARENAQAIAANQERINQQSIDFDHLHAAHATSMRSVNDELQALQQLHEKISNKLDEIDEKVRKKASTFDDIAERVRIECNQTLSQAKEHASTTISPIREAISKISERIEEMQASKPDISSMHAACSSTDHTAAGCTRLTSDDPHGRFSGTKLPPRLDASRKPTRHSPFWQ
jgi:hypothetical protein